MAITNGYGADAALECVGTKEAIESAFQAVRAGGRVGRVGVPHDVDYNEWIDSLFWKNIQLGGEWPLSHGGIRKSYLKQF